MPANCYATNAMTSNNKVELAVLIFKMARTRGPSCAEPARRSSRLATRTTQAPRPLISQPPSKPARGRGPSSRGGRLAHAVRQQKGCGVSGQPSLSPSFSVATDSPPSPPSSSPSRPLPVPCHSSSPPVSHAGNDVQPSSPPAAVSSPVARAPLRPQRYFSAPKSTQQKRRWEIPTKYGVTALTQKCHLIWSACPTSCTGGLWLPVPLIQRGT